MITLSNSQQDVVEGFTAFLLDDDQKEMVITGAAGTGKSFLVKYLAETAHKQIALVNVLEPNRSPFYLHFTATTNKATDVLRSMVGGDVPTIHSLLGLRVHNDIRTGKTELRQKGEIEDLNEAIVFVDEASMVNQELLNWIRRAQADFVNCKFVYIGDSYQLPPVKEEICAVFSSKKTSVFTLKEIQRQVAGSPIITLSTKYRDSLDDHTLEWPIISNDNGTIIMHDKKETFFEAIKQAYTQPHEANDYKVIAWSNDRVREYNKWIRRLRGMKGQFAVGEVVVTNKPLMRRKSIVAPTDTMHTILDVSSTTVEGVRGYDIQLAPSGVTFFQPADWNDTKPLLKKHVKEAKQTNNWAAYFHIKESWVDLRPIHASTVHKAQGSTYREVFVDLGNIGKNNKWREVARLAYVAITRASTRVHVFGTLHNRYTKKPLINLLEGFTDVKSL